MQPQEECFSNDTGRHHSPLSKKQRLAAPEVRTSRFFQGGAAGGGIPCSGGFAASSRVLKASGPPAHSNAPKRAVALGPTPQPTTKVGLPTEEDLETGLWSPERIASPPGPSQGIAKRLQLSRIPITHREVPAENPSPSVRPESAPHAAAEHPSSTPAMDPDTYVISPNAGTSGLQQRPSVEGGGVELFPGSASPGGRGSRAAEKGDASFRMVGAALTSPDPASHSSGGSSGGAKGAAQAGACSFADEYASVFDFL